MRVSHFKHSYDSIEKSVEVSPLLQIKHSYDSIGKSVVISPKDSFPKRHENSYLQTNTP